MLEINLEEYKVQLQNAKAIRDYNPGGEAINKTHKKGTK